jgi:16S rRNA G966 N2-methylase RsmD
MLASLASSEVSADVCFLDPPYAELQEAVTLLHQIADGKLMNPFGWIILEHSRRDVTPDAIGQSTHAWKRTRLLIQGDSALSFYRREA